MGTRILAGRYELLDRIGDGGMAVVYKARCRLLNRFVAIKILKPDFIKDVKFIENFKKESQAAASLSHPNIVNVYDVGREGNINYIVMELIEGRTLSDVIKEEAPLDYRRAIEIAKQIASALSLAHKNHIIHRDVKPHNILITQDGTAKITDFGIAKAVTDSTLVDNDGMVMGSVHYFAPEQARGGYVDEKSDIYALGIVLYEMLTGKVPFDGNNPVSIALMHVNDEMVPPSKIASGIPPRLEQIVMKATDKIQVNRYKSADEMLEALSNLEYVTSIVGDSAVGGVRRHKNTEQEMLQSDGHAKTDAEKKDTDKMGKKEKNGKPKIKINKLRVLAIILALVCAIPASIVVGSFLGIGPAGNIPEVAVPNLIGLTLEDAEEELDSIGLRIRVGDEVISEEFDAGTIVSQDTPEDSIVREGRTIVVNVSIGTRDGTNPRVPRVLGMTADDAVAMIELHGFQVGSRTSRPDNAPIGIIISQTPEQGTEARAGTTINFVTSEGRAEATMPELLGKNIEAAKSELESAGLTPGNVTTEHSDAFEKEQVMWQQYRAGETLAHGTAVNFRVSLGPAAVVAPPEPVEPEEPRPVTLVLNYADLADNQVFFLTVTLTDAEGTRNIFTNQQRIRDDGSETITLTGRGQGTVTVIIDGTAVMRRDVNFNTGVLT
ncbi:MAG: Stk1 family PASTA domain-containing Ser/Thr kinase [Clostridiales bacterium]|nr:Stk1 family PASTA domain-containing Ser/Thr kinase [Clostridiales bacterium]